MEPVLKFFKKHIVGLGLTIGSILFVLFLHRIHVFDYLELKAIDVGFKIRGPLSGWAARSPIPKESEPFNDLNANGKWDEDEPYEDIGNKQYDTGEQFQDLNSNGVREDDEPYDDAGNGKWDKGLDVVIVDLDDESYRLVPWTWPYSREVWAMVIRNLSRAGAKVIVFDIQFDAQDRKSEYLRDISRELRRMGLRDIIPAHGDSVFAEAIREVQASGTSIIIASKIVHEPTSMPPQHLELPNKTILTGNPETGLVGVTQDRDVFTRRYYAFNSMMHEPEKWYLPMGMKAIKAYLDFPDDVQMSGDAEKGIINFGPITIPTYGRSSTFLINYYGPASGAKLQGEEPWKTFNRYPLSSVVDVMDVDLKDFDEDSDWMEFFMEDSPMYGLLGESPFKDKIVLIGISVEIVHDTKQTPFYSFAGQPQLMPGVEVHVNAIQTLIDQNFIKVFGSEIGWSEKSRLSHTLLIAGLSLLTFVFLSFMNPLFAGLSMVAEIIIFFSVALGAFTADSWWILKTTLISILPDSWLRGIQGWVVINTPEMGESRIIPVVASTFGIFFAYTSNVLYKFIVEQKDKKFLKDTFGAYISPELIDQMYEEKQEPKLGGDVGFHTAFFSDIQSFSSFSEVLEPEKMVSMMNEYLTEMTETLLNRQGTLDKYIGDAIVAFYGAPIPVENHEYQACMTAIEMSYKLAELRDKWKSEEGWPEIVCNMQHRIGISSGDLVTGNMGSTMRMNYTMMGDTVNLTARLESSAKQYGVYIQVGERTYERIKDNFEWRILDYVRVKGRKHPVRTYELLAEKGKLDEVHIKLLPIFHEGIDLYNTRKWDKALKAFEESEKLEDMFAGRPTNPSRVYIERCKFFQEKPPGDDWDGVWTLTAK